MTTRTRSATRTLFASGVLALAVIAGTSYLPAYAEAPAAQEQAKAPPAIQILTGAVNKWADLVEPSEDQSPQTLTTTIKVVRGEGLPREVRDLTANLSLRAPDRLRLSATIGGDAYTIGRAGQNLWVHMPSKHFALVGSPDVPRFKAFPEEKGAAELPALKLPISREQLALLPLLVHAKLKETTQVNGQQAHVLDLALLPKAAELLGVKKGSPAPRAQLTVRASDSMPLRLAVNDGQKLDAEVEFTEISVAEADLPAEQWKLSPAKDDKVEVVSAAHLAKFFETAPKIWAQEIPTLGPATGDRRLVATEGKGRLEMIDGTRVLFLKGSPEEMGRQHGVLLKREIHDVMDKILYGIGVGSSFDKGNWFFGEIEGAQARLEPYIDAVYLREMDALASAIHRHPQEARLSNFFPELFHCSGFAVYGAAVKDGHLYHGRILDYMKGVGLEQNAVVIVQQPDDGRHAWVNLSYAGFIGSISAMNEKGIAIGEMGGGGYGNWDGKPMAQLMREIMERADTLDEAVEIMRKGPRTCEYYYVISSGKEMRAVGIAATPTRFEVIGAGEAHPQLPHPVKDAVLMSAGDRYEELARRAKAGHGKFSVDSARDLMTRPVCMTSNIQSVLFRPDTLDFWVANADGKNVASHTRYTHYNLAELIKSEPPKESTAKAAAQ